MMRVNSNRGVILRVRFIALLPLSSWSPPATRWRHKRYIRNLHQWGAWPSLPPPARACWFLSAGGRNTCAELGRSWATRRHSTMPVTLLGAACRPSGDLTTKNNHSHYHENNY
jgi:hypothetical protein